MSRCTDIITDLLDHTRIELHDTTICARDPWLAQTMADDHVPQGVSVQPECAGAMTVKIDSQRLRRAINNVLDNALQAMKDNTDDDARPPALIVSCNEVGGWCEIAIEDTGPGIPEEIRGREFEPLVSTKGFGVGLGLAIVQEILAQHGGGVSLGPAAAGGTRVRLRLPLVRGAWTWPADAHCCPATGARAAGGLSAGCRSAQQPGRRLSAPRPRRQGARCFAQSFQ